MKLKIVNILQASKYFFLSPDRFSGKNDVTSDKVHFRPDIRQNFFLKKIKKSLYGS